MRQFCSTSSVHITATLTSNMYQFCTALKWSVSWKICPQGNSDTENFTFAYEEAYRALQLQLIVLFNVELHLQINFLSIQLLKPLLKIVDQVFLLIFTLIRNLLFLIFSLLQAFHQGVCNELLLLLHLHKVGAQFSSEYIKQNCLVMTQTLQ